MKVRPNLHPGRLFVERFGPVRADTDVLRYADFLREEAGLDDCPPVDLALIHRHFGIPEPVFASLPGQQGLLLDGDTCLILIDAGDPGARQRFSHAHELMELLFGAHDQLPSSEHWSRRFGPQAKEQLCEEGAAALLMPRSSFVPRVHDTGVSLATASELAEEYATSLLATLFQMVQHGPGKHILALWHYNLKPSQRRMIPSEIQPSLFGEDYDLSIPKKLRVWWSTRTRGMKEWYLPKDKSAPEDSIVSVAYTAWFQISGVERADFGKTQADCFVEAKPVTVGSESCVVTILHLPNDTECAIAAAQFLGE